MAVILQVNFTSSDKQSRIGYFEIDEEASAINHAPVHSTATAA